MQEKLIVNIQHMKRGDTLKLRLALRKKSNRPTFTDTELYSYINRFAIHVRKDPRVLGGPRRAVSTSVINWMRKNVKGISWGK